MEFETIIYEKKDLVSKITINRPDARNSLNMTLMKELCMALEDSGADSGIGVVVVTGSGNKIFCPGLDLNWAKYLFNDTNEVFNMVNQYSRIIYDIRNIGKPVIARVNGLTAGGGCEIVIHCDLAIASEDARFMQGEGATGAIATFATQSLAPVIGDKRARWWLFTDEVIDARTAVEWGLVNKAVPYDKLDEEVEKVCENLLNKAMWSLRFTKTQMNVWFDMVYHTFFEGRDFWTLQSTRPEPRIGISAFLEKKTPDHKGRRAMAAEGKVPEFFWGPPVKECQRCGARWLPEEFSFCGKCGEKL